MNNHPDSLDFQIAQLNIMITEFIMRDHHCYTLAQAICTRLTNICQHVEIAFFPQQQIVYLKMLKVWQAINHSSSVNKGEIKPAENPSKLAH